MYVQASSLINLILRSGLTQHLQLSGLFAVEIVNDCRAFIAVIKPV
jgi:hypothetical protein